MSTPDAVDAPQTAKDALGWAGTGAPASEWLPPGPEALTGILARLSGYGPADDEFWHETRRNAERAYLGTKLNWHPAAPRQTLDVTAHDLHSDLHKLMLEDLKACWPWTDVLDLMGALAVGLAAQRFGATAVRQEWADCMALGSKYEKVDMVAEALHDCRRRDERAAILKAMLEAAYSPEEVDKGIERLREVR